MSSASDQRFPDNLRDVAGSGGYPTPGARMRPGEVYRSAELDMTAEQAANVAALGVTRVYDLRETMELEHQPSTPIPGAEHVHTPVLGIPMDRIVALASPDEAYDTMLEVYRGFVQLPGARAAFAAVLTGIAEATAPVLFHCSGGKDRTGWTASLLQQLVGVEEATVIDDYLISNEASKATRTKYLTRIHEHMGDHGVSVFEKVLIVDENYLQAGWDALAQQYRTLDRYLSEGLGLSDATLDALRTKLTNPSF